METDETLYRRYLSGDNDALRELLERHRRGLILFLYGMVGSMEEAEDLMMDAFAAVLAKEKTFYGGSSFKTWLFAIARHKAGSFLRKRHFTEAEPEIVSLAQEEPDEQLFQTERRRILFSAMTRLHAEYRQALILFYFEDMDCQTMASVMKISRRKASDLLYRGKQALKKELEQEGYTDAQLG
ncbi:MAG: sigma-70 family RNA polymerase sigma factor [Faecalibacterium sp.]|nr:sigma-70 family RNA polymerase sigma factor [Faecalibacterium sp.]